MDTEDSAVPEKQVDAEEPSLQVFIVPNWQSLSVAETLHITLRAQTQIVVPVGPVGCGKTTLLATIYDQFLLGPFAGWLFGGSETLLGFEQRSFLSRVVSGGSAASTERTSISAGEQFLHLRIQDEGQTDPPLDVLLADVSGELFREIADRPASAAGIASLQSAHYLAVLLDG